MDYCISQSVQDALQALKEADGKGMVLAGGTDLVLDAESGKKPVTTFVDIMRIPEMRELKEEDGRIIIGGAVTLTEITRSPLIKRYYPSLAKGCGTVGSLQMRNIATLVGNVLSAQPAADGAMALAPLIPTFTVVSQAGSREMKMEEMYAGFGRSAIDSTREIVTRIAVPVPRDGEAAAFVRLELRKSLSLPMLNAAARAWLVDGIVAEVHINMGPVGVGPKRALTAEKWLTGKALTAENAKEAGRLALQDAKPRSNPLRGSKEYREATLPVIVERALKDIGRQLGVLEQ